MPAAQQESAAGNQTRNAAPTPKGIYQNCGEQHLHRYLAEYEFRYNNRAALGCNDTDRSVAALSGIIGKRLTYKSANQCEGIAA